MGTVLGSQNLQLEGMNLAFGVFACHLGQGYPWLAGRNLVYGVCFRGWLRGLKYPWLAGKSLAVLVFVNFQHHRLPQLAGRSLV